MVTPLLRQLRRLFPGASLEVLCERGCAQILACNSRVDGMLHLKRGASAREFLGLAAELRRRAYDLVLDAQSLPKTALLARRSGAPRRCGFASHPLKDLCYTRPYRRLNNDYSALDRLKLLDRALDAPPEAAAESMIDFGDLVLEFGQFVDEFHRDQVRARGEDLSQLNEGWAQFLKGHPDSLGS